MATGYLDETPLKQERLNPYVSQYVPIPLDIMFKEGQLVQQRGDANLEKLDKELEALQKIKVRPVDEPLRNQIIGEYIEARDAMVNGDVNPASYDFRRQATNMVNKFANRSDLKDLTNLYGLYDQRQKTQQALNQRGKRVLDFNNPLTSQAYDPTTGLGAFNMERLGVEELMDRHAEMEKYYNQMMASGSAGALKRAANPLFLERTSWQGISNSAVGKVANAAMDSYLNTDVGAQQFEDYTKLQGMSADEAKKAIFGELLGVGQERVHGKSTTQTVQDPGAVDALKRKRDIAQHSLPNMYVQKLKAASNGDGAHINPEDWGDMMGLTKSENKVLENQFGTTYNVNLNDQNAVFGVGNSGRQFDQGTWDIAFQMADLLAKQSGIEADITDMQNSDGILDDLSDGFTLFGRALTGYGNGWTGNKEGKGFYYQGKRKELEPIIKKLDELRKTHPKEVAMYLANKSYFNSEEGFNDLIAAKVLTQGGNMDVRISPSGNNMQTLNGNVYYNVEGLGTEAQMRARLGDVQYEALVDGGYLKVMETDEDENTYVSIPGIHLKDDLTMAKGNRYNTSYYDGTQTDVAEAGWAVSTANYFHDQANISRGKDVLMEALDLSIGGDDAKLNKFVESQITNSNLSTEHQNALKKDLEAIKKLRIKGLNMQSEAAYRDMLNNYFKYSRIKQKTSEDYDAEAIEGQADAVDAIQY